MVSSRQVLLCWGYKTDRYLLPQVERDEHGCGESSGKVNRRG